jgi:hypothetical protein
VAQEHLAKPIAEPDEPDDAIYDALVAALRSNARGRAFLDEYARRVRAADTTAALDALARIEALLRERSTDTAQEAPVGHDDAASLPVASEEPQDMKAGLIAQVMALSPDERIALFS